MNVTRLAGVIALLGIGLVGCKDKPRVTSYDAGPLCESPQRLVGGECRAVCSRDGDCASGERCNLFTGSCEARPPVPDAGQIVIPCTTGADRCTADAKAVETCGADNTWSVSSTCPVPNGFCKNEKCLSCQPGATACAADAGIAADGGPDQQVQVCLDDGTGLRLVECAPAASCTTGECRECVPNSTRCSPDGKSLQTCQKTSDETQTWKWNNTGDNFDATCITQVCEQSPAGSPQCKAPSCVPGATTCKTGSTTIQQVCSTTGSFNDVSCTGLADGGFDSAGTCENGICVHECEQAAAEKSYFGCEYWTSILDNSVDTLFKGGTGSGQGTLASAANSGFTLVVTNRSVSPATVVVTRFIVATSSVQTVATVTVPGRNDPATKGLMNITVPWQSIGNQPCSGTVITNCGSVGVGATGQARYAYKVTSTRPITLYQFNPLEAVRYTKSCNGSVSPGGSYDCACGEGGGGSSSQCTTCVNSFLGLGCNGADFDGIGQCLVAPGGTAKKCAYFTNSNDASLLLPAHDLGTSHVAISQEHTYFTASGNSPPAGDGNGSITIVGTQDATTVTVKSSAVTLAGGGVTAMAKGESRNFTLNSYDVLQLSTNNLGANNFIECANNPFATQPSSSKVCRVDNDLTGTIVTSNKPIALFGGAACTLRPYDRVACDHIEEQIFPFSTWGKTFVAQRSAPLRLANNTFAYKAPDHWKVVASCSTTAAGTPCPNGTTFTFSTPPTAANVLPPNRCLAGTSLAANNCRLAGGSFMEFKSTANFTVLGDFPIAVAQIFPGQGSTTGATTDPVQGDPSLVLLPPVEQWRATYTVLAAPGILDNYLGLAIDSTKVASIEVDGIAVPLSSFTTIAGSNYVSKNHAVSVGTHTVAVIAKTGISPLPGAGVTVFGYDQYVSYGYTGGLDLTTIVSGINPGG